MCISQAQANITGGIEWESQKETAQQPALPATHAAWGAGILSP